MEKWKFGIDNNGLIDLVLSGKKVATCSIYNGEKTIVGDYSILLNDKNREICKLKTIDIIILKFKDITWDLASLEGEFSNLKEWKESHYNFFKKENNEFNEDVLIEFEKFEVVEIFKK